MRVLAAMSGGVDSAVAAARAVEAGHDVTGVHLALSRNPQTYRSGARGCCTLEDARDARRAADVIGIPFYVWDLADRFHAEVVDDFVAEYAAGRTPNPCLRCNEKIKFAAVLDRAVALGFDGVVTGHHARRDEAGRLRRSADPGKDQSYVLAVLTRAQLERSRFPLGDSTKAQVRQEAAARRLAVAEKPDSHDICFIADGDTRGFLAGALGEAPGEIVDALTGAVVGRHSGGYAYTVGQRRGLGLERPGPDGRRRYVLSVTPVTNTVTVGPAEALEVTTVVGERVVWTGSPAPDGPLECEVQLRAHGEPVPAVVTVAGGVLTAQLRRPVRGVAPGQAVVAYRPDPAGDLVLGSATIAAAAGPEPPQPDLSRTGAAAGGVAWVIVNELPWPAGSATGVGSLPGTDIIEAVKIVLGELPDFPYLPELPARGPGADMIGRSAGLLVELPVELYAARWRIAAHPGRDARRTADLRQRDLDALTGQAEGYAGALKLQVSGPWTLAANLELRTGGPLLRDPGAVRDLVGSLAEGLRHHVAEVAARVPGARLVLQLDEASLPAVLAGQVPTESGFSTLRAVERSTATEALHALTGAADAAGVPVIVHCCAPDVPIDLIRDAGAVAVALDLELVTDLEPLGEALEAGLGLLAGAIPTRAREVPAAADVAGGVRALWHRFGFPPERLPEQVVVTQSCGLAGAAPEYALAALAAGREAAARLRQG